MTDVQTLMARLKAKRFRQIFNYLDQDQAGVIDLLDLATSEMLFNITSLSSVSCISNQDHINSWSPVSCICNQHHTVVITQLL